MPITTNLYITTPESEYDAQKVILYNELVDIFDGALGGASLIETTGDTTTLTTAEATRLRLSITGTLESDATIEIPISSTTGRLRMWIIYNGTTGSFTLTVKLSGGEGVIVLQGQTVLVTHDDTNVVAVQSVSTPWTAPTLLNSWANYNAANNSVGYRLRNGRVELRGIIKDGSAINTTAFTLPEGYRPAKEERIVVSSNDAVGVVYISTSGNVTPVIGSTTWFSLDNVAFDPA